MKKNKTMRAASILLALTLITSCFVGGTFAKYVTSKQGSDTARVAKFGVELTSAGTAFNTTYAKDDGSAVTIGADSVVSSNDDKLVAPGTKGDMAAVSVTGTPEVAVRITNKAVVTLGENWKDEKGNYYCPLEITIKGTTLKGTSYSSAAEFKKAIEDKIAEVKADYAPNTNLGTGITDADVDISWAWTFEGNTDEKDTYLGDQAAKGNAATIQIDLTTTVTQID